MQKRISFGLTIVCLHTVVVFLLVFLKNLFGWGAGFRPLPEHLLRLIDFPVYQFSSQISRILGPPIDFLVDTIGLPVLIAISLAEATFVSLVGGVYYLAIGVLYAQWRIFSNRKSTATAPRNEAEP